MLTVLPRDASPETWAAAQQNLGNALWSLTNGTWSPFTPDLQTYDSFGNLSFTIPSFASAYAVTAVPEPASLLLLSMLPVLLRRRQQ